MKILVVLTGEMCFDGITNSVYNYYAAMDRNDMQIDVVSARATNYEMQQKFETIGLTVYPLETRDKHTLKYILQLINLIHKEKYDILHAHGNSATLAFETTAATVAGCKTRIIHSRNSFCEHTKVDKLLRPLMYATYTDGFSCGEKAGKWLFGNRQFTIMQNGKDIDRFLFNSEKRKEYRDKLSATEDSILLGHVGLFHRQKNHPFLIEIFEEICKKSDNYRLVLIGEGEDQQLIQDIVYRKGLTSKVIFLGRQSNVEDWLNALDIMVFPSLFEGMPNVVLEWQISGLPVLLSDVITRECKITGNVEYFSLDAGTQGWANKILTISVQEREGKQQNIRSAFENAGFDISKNAEVLKDTYNELVFKRRKK